MNLDRFSGYPNTEECRPQREPPDFMQAAKERMEEEMELDDEDSC